MDRRRRKARLVPVRDRKEGLIRSRRKRALGAAIVCTAIGTTLVLSTLAGVGGMFDAIALIIAAVAFAAAAIFMVISIVMRRRSRRYAITYQPLASQQQDDP